MVQKRSMPFWAANSKRSMGASLGLGVGFGCGEVGLVFFGAGFDGVDAFDVGFVAGFDGVDDGAVCGVTTLAGVGLVTGLMLSSSKKWTARPEVSSSLMAAHLPELSETIFH